MTDMDTFDHIWAVSQDAVDARNKDFYGRFPYPWSALTFPFVADPQCGTVFLNQDLGDWTHSRIPHNPRIWVAGCGTNQAVLTALRFPEAEVLGTDLSTSSLELAQEAASRLGIHNLRLEEQSLNASSFQDEFDYIICTGVIHHNAHPAITLGKLSTALKRDGILELMVYSSYHMLLPSAYQKFIHLLFPGEAAQDLDAQLLLTKALIDTFPVDNKMSHFLRELKNQPEVALADLLLQPVEHSYTIESLAELLKEASLEFWLPCVNSFDKATSNLTWNMAFDSEQVSRYYDVLPDIERWHIGNLLLLEQSPMLWFYVQRSDSSFKRKSEREICDRFLETKFARYSTTVKQYIGQEGSYRLLPKTLSHPLPSVPDHALFRRIFHAVDPARTLGDILHGLGVEPSFYLVNLARIQLTTTLFPYLQAVEPAE